MRSTCTKSRSAAQRPVSRPTEVSPLSQCARSAMPPPATHQYVTSNKPSHNATPAPSRTARSILASASRRRCGGAQGAAGGAVMTAITSIASAQLRVARQGKDREVRRGTLLLLPCRRGFIVENSTEPEPCKTCQLAMKTTKQQGSSNAPKRALTDPNPRPRQPRSNTATGGLALVPVRQPPAGPPNRPPRSGVPQRAIGAPVPSGRGDSARRRSR
jgi:hypothetical protein